MTSRRRILLGTMLLAALAGCLLWMMSGSGAADAQAQVGKGVRQTNSRQANSSEKARGLDKARRPQSIRRGRVAAKPILDWTDDDEDDKRTPAEKALAERIDKALDEENFEAAIACAKEALTCGNVEIRQAMVDTLGWFGARALPELTPFMVDADEDVRQSAQNEWSMALSDIEDDGEKISAVEMAMQVLTDEDFLEEISGEYIGIDEKMAVESLLRIIEGPGGEKGISKAKEAYEFVTGEEFTDRAAAEKWIEEEYQPPTDTN